MRITRYGYQARKTGYRGTEIRKDSYRDTKIPEECPRSPQDGLKIASLRVRTHISKMAEVMEIPRYRDTKTPRYEDTEIPRY